MYSNRFTGRTIQMSRLSCRSLSGSGLSVHSGSLRIPAFTCLMVTSSTMLTSYAFISGLCGGHDEP
jgi:hypothetical protein